MRRRLTALLAMVMLVMMLATSPAAFAGPKSENSCGAANPNIGVPAHPGNKGDEFLTCGYENNPNGTPPGHEK
jgi:hypothetical protein